MNAQPHLLQQNTALSGLLLKIVQLNLREEMLFARKPAATINIVPSGILTSSNIENAGLGLMLTEDMCSTAAGAIQLF
jgi:hypothetical protein